MPQKHDSRLTHELQKIKNELKIVCDEMHQKEKNPIEKDSENESLKFLLKLREIREKVERL